MERCSLAPCRYARSRLILTFDLAGSLYITILIPKMHRTYTCVLTHTDSVIQKFYLCVSRSCTSLNSRPLFSATSLAPSSAWNSSVCFDVSTLEERESTVLFNVLR